MIALQIAFLGVTGSAGGVFAMELLAVMFDFEVSLVMLINLTLLSSGVGVLLFTGINVDDGLILDFGTLSLSSGHKPDLLKLDMMMLDFYTKASLCSPSTRIGNAGFDTACCLDSL